MLNRFKIGCRSLIYDYIYSPLFFRIVYFRDWRKIKNYYGKFEELSKQEIKKNTFLFDSNESNVCGQLYAEIVKIISGLKTKLKNVLLDGDSKSVTNQFKTRFKIKDANILTVGIGNNFDYDWNFENDIPVKLTTKFDLIVSQAMFEHLIDPYKHFSDLVSLLNDGGFLVIHTEMPGYNYHRYPIDTIRFFPDWFESSAIKLGIKVVKRYRRDFRDNEKYRVLKSNFLV